MPPQLCSHLGNRDAHTRTFHSHFSYTVQVHKPVCDEFVYSGMWILEEAFSIISSVSVLLDLTGYYVPGKLLNNFLANIHLKTILKQKTQFVTASAHIIWDNSSTVRPLLHLLSFKDTHTDAQKYQTNSGFLKAHVKRTFKTTKFNQFGLKLCKFSQVRVVLKLFLFSFHSII